MAGRNEVEWENGICGCFNDCSLCKHRQILLQYNVMVPLYYSSQLSDLDLDTRAATVRAALIHIHVASYA